ncbi:MAG TPA: putative glycoside hydrolase [Solirubrobacterales bacterium]|nr:putative glycoside hydrolase [Solirubrobacterales bacterium]
MDSDPGTAPRRLRHSLRRFALAGALVCWLLGAGASPAAAAPEGDVNFELHADSSFDSYLTSSTSAQKTWMNEHYSTMLGYPPFFDQALSWAPPASFYKDLYALYVNDPADQAVVEQHPNWVLHDAQGNKLYIQFDCNGTTCTQYAADVGNQQFRDYWINDATSTMSKGYDGLFVDDVNLEMKVSNGAGTFTRPIDPRTGQPMTDADWRRYMAEFTEQIRAAFPDKEITHNSLWWMDRTDPYVQRQVAAADYVYMERGFNDTGIGGGSGQWSYQNYLGYADWVHSQGAGVIPGAHGLNSTSAMFELASYLLISNGGDRLSTHYRATPADWWQGWDTNLGAANGARYSWQGLLRRDFSGGIALVNQPGASSVTVQLPSGVTWTDLNGNVVTSVTLGARQGAVLFSDAPPPSGTPDSSTSTGTTSGSTSGGTSGSTDTSTSTSTSGSTLTIKSNRKKVKSGRKVLLSGKAEADSVEVRAYVDGSWQVVAQDDSVTDGGYSVALKAKSPGVVQFKAAAPGLQESGTVSVKVKA